MKARHIILLTAMAAQIILFFYCLIKKSNHVPAGYLCAVVSLILLICTGWLLLFPKVTPPETTGPYQVNREDCFYTDSSRLEAYADDGSFRELPVSFWCPTEVRSPGAALWSYFLMGASESEKVTKRYTGSLPLTALRISRSNPCRILKTGWLSAREISTSYWIL